MENLGIDIKLMLAQLINFVLFFIIIKKFVAKPFQSFLQTERQKEAEKQKLLEDAQKQEEALANKQKELEKKMKQEFDKTLAEAKVEANKIKEEIVLTAKKEGETLKEAAKKEIEQEKEALYKQVKKKVSDLSLFLVAKSLREILDTEERKKVSAKILSSLPKTININEN